MCTLALSSLAQTTTIISGKVVNLYGKGLPFVNIKLAETNQYIATKENGNFEFQVNKTNATITLEFTFIGYQKFSKEVIVNIPRINLGEITLREVSLNLESIEINAKRDYKGSSNSSLIIGRDIIEQIPALSLSDLLNQIPNKKITPPSLQSVQNITLRSAFSDVSSGRNIYEMSNSFGVAIVLDGNTISNNMNMQSFNPQIFGSAAVNTNINIGSYSLNGSPTSGSYSGDFAFSGIDLRQIPADHIESIEVIAGVPSAKYGDLSDGAILVERQAGKSPAYFRMQLRDNATSYGFSKGLDLGKKNGALNVNVNYVNSFADNRDKLKAYKRLNLGTMHTAYFGATNRLKNTFSLDYGRNLDGVKKDADAMDKIAKFDSWNFSVANRTSLRINNTFLKNISFNVRYSESHQVSYTEEFINEPYIILSDATTTGIHEGKYIGGIYTAQSLIDGRPVNFSAKLDFNGEFQTGKLVHFLSYGGGYSYGANKGLGQVLDPNRPRTLTNLTGNTTGTNRSERYYDFNLAVAQQDYDIYVEDMFIAKVLKRPLNVRAGVRYDMQNNLPSLSPRINLNYEWSKALRFGLAYGLAYKSPALGQRYPGPSYFEVPLVNAYNGKAAESIYLAYVDRYDPSAKDLKSSNSEMFEFSSQLKIKKYNLSLNAFLKNYENGIGNLRMDQVLQLPVYTPTFVPGQQPTLTVTGTRRVFHTSYKFDNNLSSNSRGFDVILTTPTYKTISTSFNISGGLFRSESISENLSTFGFTNTTTNPNFAVTGFYAPAHSVNYISNGRVTSTTHIPKISLFIQLTAEATLYQKTIRINDATTPLAYYTADYRYIIINNFDKNNTDYGHLYRSQAELDEDNIPRIIPNFHLSVGKEIKKRFKIAFNAYNFLNYRPYYTTSTGTYRFPNSSPTFGAELSLKL